MRDQVRHLASHPISGFETLKISGFKALTIFKRVGQLGYTRLTGNPAPKLGSLTMGVRGYGG